MKYKDPQTGNLRPYGTKVEDTLPVGTEVDYDGNDVPEGWEEVGISYETQEDTIWTGDATGSSSVLTLSKNIEQDRIYRFYLHNTFDYKTVEFSGKDILASNSTTANNLVASKTDWVTSNTILFSGIRLYKSDVDKIALLQSPTTTTGGSTGATENTTHIYKVTEIYEKPVVKRIRKVSGVIPTRATLIDGYSNSDKDGFTAKYINNHSVVVSSTEPVTDRKKVWLQHGSNIEDKTYILNDNDVYEEYVPLKDKFEIKTATFNLNTGYSFSNQYISSPYLRKIGNIVELNMIVNCANNVPSTDVQIAILPEGFRPKYTQFDICGLGASDGYGWTYSAVGIVVIETGGGVRIRNIQGTYKYALINIKYLAD